MLIGFDHISWVLLLDLVVAVPVCAHILLTKDTPPVTIGWIALVLLSPFIGALLYLILGINRVQRRARKMRDRRPRFTPALGVVPPGLAEAASVDRDMMRATGAVQDLPLTAGNRIEPLIDGDEAYPAMLTAIGQASHSIALSAYIFDHDKIGETFVSALAAAHGRGVTVRVLIDDMGLRYSPSAIDTLLRRHGLESVRFIPTRLRLLPYINLRNHRKILIVDGREAFIGGMNIRHGHALKTAPRHPVRDIHFRVTGPVIDQLSDLFEEDWRFTGKPEIKLPGWQNPVSPPGGALARLVPDGPDHHFERMQWVILCAIGASRSRVRVMTPYFLPNEKLTAALTVAALRGIDVQIIVPARTNIAPIGWAMAANYEYLLEHGVRLFESGEPFDHSKLMVVDDRWSLIGSMNWDQRSFRLNFEANLECFDDDLAARLIGYFERRKAESRPVTIDIVRATPLALKLRNRFVRLFSPYL